MIRRIKRITIALCVWVLTLPIYAQSLVITREFNAIPNSSVSAQYKNEFGRWEKPDLDDTFPYALIRIRLDGNERDVTMAKRKLGLYLGTLRMVLDKRTDKPNELLFLVPAGAGHVEIQCGDGCKNQTIIDLPRLQSNTVYLGHVHYMPAEMEQTIVVPQGPQFYSCNLTVHPADAKVEIVMLNGIKQECSVVDGVAELKLEEGEYRYTISAEHYYPLEGVLSVPTTSTDIVLSLNPKVGWLSVTSDSTDLTDLSVEVLHIVEPANGKKMTKKEVKQNTIAHSLPLQDLVCDAGKYQLKIEKKKYFDYHQTLTLNEGDNIVLSPKMRPHIINTFILAEAGIALNPEWGVGLMFGQLYDGVGWYVKGRSNWNIPKKDKYGGKDFDTTKETTSLEWIVDAGMVVDFLMKQEKKDKDNFLGVYFGAGYGSRERYWNEPNLGWIGYGLNTYQGVSMDVGLIGSFRGITLMAGMNTIAFKYMEIEVGVGITF